MYITISNYVENTYWCIISIILHVRICPLISQSTAKYILRHSCSTVRQYLFIISSLFFFTTPSSFIISYLQSCMEIYPYIASFFIFKSIKYTIWTIQNIALLKLLGSHLNICEYVPIVDLYLRKCNTFYNLKISFFMTCL